MEVNDLWWNKIHKRDKWIGFTVSFFIHLLVFFLGGAVFIKTAQYSIQPVSESIQVDLVQPPPEVQAPPIEPKKIAVVQPAHRRNSVQSMARVVEAKPDYFQNPPPEYPALAKQMRQEGLVMLSVDVDRDGTPVSVEVIQSSGHRMLDQAALKAVRHWKFQPGRMGDLRVESKVKVPIKFRLVFTEN